MENTQNFISWQDVHFHIEQQTHQDGVITGSTYNKPCIHSILSQIANSENHTLPSISLGTGHHNALISKEIM